MALPSVMTHPLVMAARRAVLPYGLPTPLSIGLSSAMSESQNDTLRIILSKSYQSVKMECTQKSSPCKNLDPRAFYRPKFRGFCYHLIIRMLQEIALIITTISAYFTPQKARKCPCLGKIRAQNGVCRRCDGVLIATRISMNRNESKYQLRCE
jgi:hypothetical protein